MSSETRYIATLEIPFEQRQKDRNNYWWPAPAAAAVWSLLARAPSRDNTWYGTSGKPNLARRKVCSQTAAVLVLSEYSALIYMTMVHIYRRADETAPAI